MANKQQILEEATKKFNEYMQRVSDATMPDATEGFKQNMRDCINAVVAEYLISCYGCSISEVALTLKKL